MPNSKGTFAVRRAGELYEEIGSGVPMPRSDHFDHDVHLIDHSGRVVNGSYYTGDQEPDISVDETDIPDELLEPHIRALLSEGKSFITQTGIGPDQRTVIWKIK